MHQNLHNGDKHVAIVIDNLVGAGAESICISTIKHLLEKKYTVDLVLLSCHGQRLAEVPESANLFYINPIFPPETVQELMNVTRKLNWVEPPRGFSQKVIAVKRFVDAVGWPVRISGLPKWKWISRAVAIANYIEGYQPNAIVSILSNSQIVTLIGRRMAMLSIPIICSVHCSRQPRKLSSTFPWLIHLFPEADGIHTVSYDLANEISDLVPDVKNRIVPIYNPTWRPELQQLAKQSTGHPWLDARRSPDVKIILAAGRLQAQKNYSLLIKALSRIRTRIDVRLIILGEGSKKKKLENLVCKLNLSDAVSMPGWVVNPYAFMGKVDLFVLSSLYEGLPNVLIEAMACGCPIVSTDCPTGPREILGDGRWGKLVPVDSVDFLADSIFEALNEKHDREALRQRASEFSSEQFIPQFDRMIVNAINQAGNVV